jgi:ABC-type Na+ efflux pump permease subunit
VRASRRIWLVARREVRERSRSPAFRAGLALMLIVVVAAIVLPAVTDPGSGTKGVAIVGAAPATLPDAIVEQGDALGTRIEVQRYEDVAAAEQAVRDGDVDVALVEGRRLEWQDEPDERLRAAVAGAIQLVALQERAEAAGIDPEALLALVASLVVDSVDLPAVRMSVLVWVVVWFILGYAVFATAYGALGSLASRTEDASSAAGPVTMILIVGYWAAYVAVAEDPEGGWSQLASFVPITAPFAMPGRIALGTAAAWEPVAAVGLTLLAIVGLVLFAGRVYSGAVLHSGAAIKLREAWRRAPVTEASTGVPVTPHRPA